MEVTKLQNLNTVMMPGQEIPVQPSLRYENIVGVAKFKDNFELVGGVNFPKKVQLLFGSSFFQLFFYRLNVWALMEKLVYF